MSAYWRLRHALWDARERLTVRLVLRYLADHDILYIHERGNGPITAAVVRSRTWNLMTTVPGATTDPLNHAHIEGS